MDDDEYLEISTSMRFIRADFLPLVLSLVEGVTGALHATATTAYNVAARHANKMHELEDFRRQASYDIETMTGDTDG